MEIARNSKYIQELLIMEMESYYAIGKSWPDLEDLVFFFFRCDVEMIEEQRC